MVKTVFIPEYAMDGLVLVKSNVFSFRVMMLEIISGKKNTSFHKPDHSLNLVGYVTDNNKLEPFSCFKDFLLLL